MSGRVSFCLFFIHGAACGRLHLPRQADGLFPPRRALCIQCARFRLFECPPDQTPPRGRQRVRARTSHKFSVLPQSDTDCIKAVQLSRFVPQRLEALDNSRWQWLMHLFMRNCSLDTGFINGAAELQRRRRLLNRPPGANARALLWTDCARANLVKLNAGDLFFLFRGGDDSWLFVSCAPG